MPEIVIDKNIPPPNGRSKYPWAKMQVGDSFFLASRSTATLNGSLGFYKSRHPDTKFTCRTVTENGVKGVRIWRIA